MNKRVCKANKEGITYWLSYSDMMAALILIFALIIAITMYQAKLDFEKQSDELGQLEEIIGVKASIIQKLMDEFGTDGNVAIDPDTGDIMFNSQILFDKGRYELKKEGKDFLNGFFPRYINILMSNDIKEHISEIIVEGHTDSDGGYIYNLGLSQNRASAVVVYCMTEKNEVLSKPEIEYLQTVLSANGKSYSEHIIDDDTGEEDQDASRRVEIKFRLADEGQIEKIIKMSKESDR